MPRYDPAARRRGVRKGRERGVWIFVPAEELERIAVDPRAAAPWYRIWTRRKTILVQFYDEGP